MVKDFLVIFSGQPYQTGTCGNKEYKFTHHLFHIQNQLFMKNFTSILVFLFSAFAAQHTLNAQIQPLLTKGAQSLRQLEGAPQMNDLPFSKDENKKVADRDDPVFRLRASRGDKWENGWVGLDSIVNVYDGQGNITKKETKYFYDAAWNNSTRYFMQYNLNGKLTEVIDQSWDGVVWFNYGRTTYEFDSNNNVILQTTFSWDGVTWNNRFRRVYQYDGNLNTDETQQDWDGANWKSTTRTLYEYNSEGQNTLYLSQIMNAGVWQNRFRISYQYTEGNLTLELVQDWENNTWENGRRWITEYDQNSNRTSYQAQQWNGSSWINWYLLNFQYNAHNDRSSYTSYDWDNSNWAVGGQFLYEYDENYNLTQYLVQGWNGASFFNQSRTKYYYDSFVSTSESAKEPLDIQAFPNPSNGTFFLSAQELDQQSCQVFIYNLLGRLCLQQACSGLTSESIDGSNLPNGTYLLQVIAQDGKQAVKHIQISK